MSEETRDAAFDAAVKADALRAEGLKGLAAITEARQASLKREHLRLAERLGAEHPRVKALEWRVDEGAARLRDISGQVARAETVTPRPGPGDWALHGYVWTADGRPAPDLTVTLADERGQWIRALGFACTDSRGYFELVGALEDKEPDQGPQIRGYIHITDANRAVLHRDEEALAAVAGHVEYREIVLTGGPARCAPPEEEAGAPAPKEPDPAGRPGPAGKKPPSRRRGERRRAGS